MPANRHHVNIWTTDTICVAYNHQCVRQEKQLDCLFSWRLLFSSGAGTKGSNETPLIYLGGQTWYFDHTHFRKKYFLVHTSVDSEQNHESCCHQLQLSDFKAKMHQIRFWLRLQTPLEELTSVTPDQLDLRGPHWNVVLDPYDFDPPTQSNNSLRTPAIFHRLWKLSTTQIT